MPGISKKTPLPHWQKVMNKAGWSTAQDVAVATGLSHGAAHNVIFGGRKKLAAQTVLKIAQAARINPSILLADIVKYTDSHHNLAS
jgi:hypothetical protein